VIYLLSRKEPDEFHAEYRSMVIRADDVRTARSLASARDVNDPESWLSSKTTSCNRLDPEGSARIVICDWRLGLNQGEPEYDHSRAK
jgi:hypothetical protein